MEPHGSRRTFVKRVNFLLVLVITGLAFQLFWEGWLWSLVVFQPETHKPFDLVHFILLEGSLQAIHTI